MQTGPQFKLLGRNPLNEMTLATPAIANGSLFIRTATRLYRITTVAPAHVRIEAPCPSECLTN